VWKPSVLVVLSRLCAGLFFLGWLAVFLLTQGARSPAAHVLRWVLGPVVTATGFTVGLAFGERFIHRQQTSYLRVFLWPSVGCAIGAGVIYSFGPMLTVLGCLRPEPRA
jgi:hypothetical protein